MLNVRDALNNVHTVSLNLKESRRVSTALREYLNGHMGAMPELSRKQRATLATLADTFAALFRMGQGLVLGPYVGATTQPRQPLCPRLPAMEDVSRRGLCLKVPRHLEDGFCSFCTSSNAVISCLDGLAILAEHNITSPVLHLCAAAFLPDDSQQAGGQDDDLRLVMLRCGVWPHQPLFERLAFLAGPGGGIPITDVPGVTLTARQGVSFILEQVEASSSRDDRDIVFTVQQQDSRPALRDLRKEYDCLVLVSGARAGLTETINRRAFLQELGLNVEAYQYFDNNESVTGVPRLYSSVFVPMHKTHMQQERGPTSLR